VIYLVRHGEAAAGWGDHPDPGLSDKGHGQAEAVAKRLAGLGANNITCSPMQRCRETALPFARTLGRDATVEPSVSEIITPDGVTDRVAWLRNLMAGEWPDDMLPWCQRAFDTVSALPDGTAIFSHFVAINAIVGVATDDRSVLVFRPDHCSITTLERDGSGRLHVAELGGDAVTQIL